MQRRRELLLAFGSLLLVGGVFVHGAVADPPTLVGLPSALVLEATSPLGAQPLFVLPSALDDNKKERHPVVACNPGPRSVFGFGTTLVTCSATDSATGEVGSGSFPVTVQDTTAPTVSVPADMTLYATMPDGQYGEFTATVTDAVSKNLRAVCAPATRSLFPIGTTVVTCSSTDASGNTGSASFAVTVRLDQTPPVLHALSIDPSNVDVSAGSAAVTVNALITDDVSGVADSVDVVFLTSTFARADVYLHRVSGDLFSGNLSVTHGGPSGLWTFGYIAPADQAGNQSFLSAQDLAAGGISAPSFTVSGAPVDHTGPLVTGLSASPSQVNTSNEATVTLTAAMSDPSGINMGDGPYFGGGSYGPSIALRSPSGKLRVEAPFTAGLGDQFEARLTLPAGAEPGLWTISSFLVTDKLGNFAHVPNFAGVQVDGIPDLTPPTIQAVLITPAAISLDAGAVAVTVSATITDNLAGIASYPLCAAIDLCLGPTVNLDYGNGAISAALTPTAGSNYSATLTVPATAIPPTATVTISASDNVGNVGSQTQTLQISRTLPRASQRPTINSFPKVHVGQTINATLPLGTAISGSQPISQSWQWQRCTLSNVCSDIPTATNANYAITNADLQHTLRAELILTNAVGTSRAYSGETSPVIP